MKKRKTMDRPRDFAHSPFRDLKPLKGQIAEGPRPPEPKKEKPPLREENDAELFLRSVSDVKRLADDGRDVVNAGEKPAPSTKVVAEDEGEKIFADAMKTLGVTFADNFPDEIDSAPPAATSRMRQLKKGTIRIDLELDLHGLTRDEALRNLEHFIAGAYNRGQKAVLIITGRGNNSLGEPVLQGAVSAWLRDKGRVMVVEFAPAPRHMGGSGAFVVFLRQKKAVE